MPSPKFQLKAVAFVEVFVKFTTPAPVPAAEVKLAAGVGLTVMVILSVNEQPVIESLTVTKYLVVTVGFAVGRAAVVELKPAAGVHVALYTPLMF